MGKQSKAEQLPGNAAVARAKYVRMAPRKVRRVVDVVRGMKTDEALSTLQFSPWRAGTPVSKVVRSAVANASSTKQLDPDALWISEAYVDEGPNLRRWRPRAQGRAYPIHKRTSHITVVVEARDENGVPVEVAPRPKRGSEGRGDRKATAAATAGQVTGEQAAESETAEEAPEETAAEVEDEATDTAEATSEAAEESGDSTEADDATEASEDGETQDDTSEEETR